MVLDGTASEAVVSGLPASLPESDRERWSLMTAGQRARAAARLNAIEAWHAGDIDIDAAVAASGLSRSRFYTIASDWRAAPSLAALGALAGAGGARQKLNPEAVNALQAVIANVYAVNKGASISQLVRLMVEASNLDEAILPGTQRLRAIVEAEIRRAEATGQAGHAMKGDVTAINLPRENGRPHLMFVLIDQGTRLVLGVWTQGDLDETSGYRGAALDAQKRIKSSLAGLKWTDRLMRMEFKVRDQVAGAGLRSKLSDGGVRAPAQAAPKRYGKYFRDIVGQRIGRVEITPARTEDGQALPDNNDMTPWNDEAVRAVVAHAIDRHNMEILAALKPIGARDVPPDDLTLALRTLAE